MRVRGSGILGKTKIFISDWQVLFREGIHFTLSGEEDLIVTGEATNNREALDFIKGNPPDIAIVNINHSDFDGINFTRRVRQYLPLVSVILVMDSENEELQYSALRCGAAACVSKDIDPEELLSMVRQITEGSVPISRLILRPGIASRILDDFEAFQILNQEVDNLLAGLTDHEKEILKLSIDGVAPGEIEKKPGFSSESVDKSVRVIRGKLEINEHCREVVETAQKGLTSVIKRTRRGKNQDDFISREEFESFRDSLIEHFKNFSEH